MQLYGPIHVMIMHVYNYAILCYDYVYMQVTKESCRLSRLTITGDCSARIQGLHPSTQSTGDNSI